MSSSRLESLPVEILLSIISYASDSSPSSIAAQHPLLTLSATSVHFHTLAEEHARILLRRTAPRLLPAATRSTNSTKRLRSNHRKKWLRWLNGRCQLCFKASKRRAIFDSDMTCCAQCDRTVYPKMTMTEAAKTHHLSKLDLFTPNRLHPTLPPLTLGTYLCMGTDTLMLSEPDVLARKAHIASLLGPDKATDAAFMRRRVAAHDRLMEHMLVMYVVRRGRVEWVAKGDRWPKSDSCVKASMITWKRREEYVRKGLQREWEAMGVQEGGREAAGAVGGKSAGTSVEEAIEIE